MRCVIVEDELPAVEILKNHISHFEELQLVKICYTATEAFEFLHRNQVDVLFLDIQMPGMSGLQLIQTLRAHSVIILTTAFREFALQGYELEVTDYLLKPISLDRFSKSVSKVFKIKMNGLTKGNDLPQQILDEPFIYIKVDREFQKIELSELMYIESLRNQLKFVTEKNAYITLMPISQVELKLPKYFLRIHRSFIVSTRYIDKFTTSYVIINGKSLPVGNFYKMNFQRWVAGNL